MELAQAEAALLDKIDRAVAGYLHDAVRNEPNAAAHRADWQYRRPVGLSDREILKSPAVGLVHCSDGDAILLAKVV